MKTTILMIHRYATDYERTQQSIYYANNLFKSVTKYKLSWCKCIPYKRGFLVGGFWKTLLLHANLMYWFYNRKKNLIFLAPEGEPQQKLTKKENMSWLKIRGLPTMGTASEVSQSISDYMNHPRGPPETLPPLGSSVPIVF